jgi:hypothetical protein
MSSPRKPLRWHLRIWGTLALLAAADIYLVRGGPREALHLPATLASKTEKSGDALYTLKIRRASAQGEVDGNTNPRQLPLLLHTDPYATVLLVDNARGAQLDTKQLIVTATTPDGFSYPLTYQPRQTGIAITLPTTYSGDTRTLEVAVRLRYTNMVLANWTLTNLPRTRRIVAEDAVPVTEQTVQGMTARAAAHRLPDGNIQVSVTPVFLASSRLACTVQLKRKSGEWASWSAPEEKAGNLGVGSYRVKPHIPAPVVSEWVPAATIGNSRYVKVTAVFSPFAEQEERVTFHQIVIRRPKLGELLLSVDADQTQVTPSGMKVTLPVVVGQDVFPLFNPPSEPGIDDLILPFRLPDPRLSSLAQQYHRPATVEFAFPQEFSSQSYSSVLGDATGKMVWYTIVTKQSIQEQTLPELPVLVRQRVDLDPITMTFVVPIQNAMPQERLH